MTTRFNINGSTSVYCGDNLPDPCTDTYSPISPSTKWLLGLFDRIDTEEPDAVGQEISRTEYTFNDDTGLLELVRIRDVGTTGAANDVVIDYVDTDAPDDGFVDREDWLTDTVLDYRLLHTYASGVRESTKVDGTTFFVYDADIDPASGLVAASRAPNGLETAYLYDALGRLLEADPTAGTCTAVEYVAASGSTGPKVYIDQKSASCSTVLAESEQRFDGHGRLINELEWLNLNCPFSRRHAAEGTMQALADAHPEVTWLGVNSTSLGHGDHLEPAAHLASNAELGIHYPVLLDPTGEAAAAYGVDVTPHLLVIDAAGAIVYQGAVDDDPMGALDAPDRENFVAEALADLAAGQAVTTPSVPAYGCPISGQ